MRIRMGSVAMALLLGACAGVSVEVPAEITEFDFDQVMSELRDCDKLSETFVGVVRQMATDLDELSDVSGGRIPANELSERIDTVVDSGYFEIAKRLGCNVVVQRVEILDRLREVDPDSPAGEDFLEEVIRQVEAEGQSSGSGSPLANASSTSVAAGSSLTT